MQTGMFGDTRVHFSSEKLKNVEPRMLRRYSTNRSWT